MAGRREKADSVQGTLKHWQAEAGQPIPWPTEISRLPNRGDADRSDAVFAAVIAGRAKEDWTAVTIEVAAQYASMTAVCDRILLELEQQGWTIASPKAPDQRIRNVLADSLTMVGQRQLALARQLGISSIAAAGQDAKTLRKNADAASQARTAMSGVLIPGADGLRDLIARPNQ